MCSSAYEAVLQRSAICISSERGAFAEWAALSNKNDLLVCGPALLWDLGLLWKSCRMWDVWRQSVKGRRKREQISPAELYLGWSSTEPKIPIWKQSAFWVWDLRAFGFLLQVCPSKWDVDALDKLMGETNKEGAEMVKCLGNVKQWWQDWFFVCMNRPRVLKRMHIKW